MKCATHPNVETELQCASCGTPICPDCLVETPVGMKCRACGLTPVPLLYRLTPAALAAGVAVGALGGTVTFVLFLMLQGFLGYLALLAALLTGRATGAAAGRASGGKRGPTLAAAVAGACVVGVLILGPDVVRLRFGVPLPGPLDLVIGVLTQPLLLMLAGLTAVFAYWRIR
jgi:hypothetical protein